MESPSTSPKSIDELETQNPLSQLRLVSWRQIRNVNPASESSPISSLPLSSLVLESSSAHVPQSTTQSDRDESASLPSSESGRLSPRRDGESDGKALRRSVPPTHIPLDSASSIEPLSIPSMGSPRKEAIGENVTDMKAVTMASQANHEARNDGSNDESIVGRRIKDFTPTLDRIPSPPRTHTSSRSEGMDVIGSSTRSQSLLERLDEVENKMSFMAPVEMLEEHTESIRSLQSMLGSLRVSLDKDRISSTHSITGLAESLSRLQDSYSLLSRECQSIRDECQPTPCLEKVSLIEESVRTLQSESSNVSTLLSDVNTRLGELVESDSLFRSDTLNRFNLMEKTVSSMQDEFASCSSLHDLRSLVDSFRESTLDTLRELPSQHAEILENVRAVEQSTELKIQNVTNTMENRLDHIESTSVADNAMHAGLLEQVRFELSSSLRELQEKTQDSVSTLKNMIDSVQTELKKSIDVLRDEMRSRFEAQSFALDSVRSQLELTSGSFREEFSSVRNDQRNVSTELVETERRLEGLMQTQQEALQERHLDAMQRVQENMGLMQKEFFGRTEGIDRHISSLSDSLREAVSSSESRMQAIEVSTSDQLQSTISTFEIRMQDLESSSTARIDSTVSSLESRLDAMDVSTKSLVDHAISDTLGRCDDIERTVTDMFNTVSSKVEKRIQDVEQTVSAHIDETVSKWETRLGDVENATMTHMNLLSQRVESQIFSVEKSSSAALETAVSNLESRIQSAQASATSNFDSIQSRTEDVSTRLSLNIDELRQNVSKFHQHFDSRCSETKSSVSSVQKCMDEMENRFLSRLDFIENSLRAEMSAQHDEISEEMQKFYREEQERCELDEIRVQLREAFDVFDKHKTGYLSMEEFRHVLTSFGEKMSDFEVQKIFQDFDLDNSGRITFDEFVEFQLHRIRNSSS